MSAPIDNGGYAFPTSFAPGTVTEEGMTLRDWFAGKALASAIDISVGSAPQETAPEVLAAHIAYKIADAMIAARKGDAA